MKAKRRGLAAALGGVAVMWLCLAVGDGGLGAKSPDPKAAGLGSAGLESVGAPSGDAFHLWLPRALAGDPTAAFRLGRVYAQGSSRAEDFGEAARWFRKAAETGHGPAQAELGMLYGKGLGVPQDYVWSYAWFAAAADNMAYGRAREQSLELRDIMAAFLSPEERARAERLAEQLKSIGAAR